LACLASSSACTLRKSARSYACSGDAITLKLPEATIDGSKPAMKPRTASVVLLPGKTGTGPSYSGLPRVGSDPSVVNRSCARSGSAFERQGKVVSIRIRF
jgi:hypothetical protein